MTSPVLRDVTPALTSVSLPLAEIGARALTLALSESAAPEDQVAFDGVVRLRESTPGRARPSVFRARPVLAELTVPWLTLVCAHPMVESAFPPQGNPHHTREYS